MSKKTSKEPQKKSLLYLLVFFGITAIFFSLLNLFFYFFSESNDVEGVRIEVDTKTSLLQQENYWKSTLKENPSYLQGWLELARIEVQLEKLDLAKNALYQARAINPNSELIKKTEEELGLFGN